MTPTRLWLAVLLGLSLGCGLLFFPPGGPVSSVDAAVPSLALQPIATGLNQPVALAHAGDGSGRLFIVELAGRIKVYDGTQVLGTPFLDISSLVSCCGERGLLGLAFHPDYASNGYFYVFYTTKAGGNLAEGDIVIARYRVSGNPQVADGGSRLVLVTIPHSTQGNHNGGQLAFGPDGHLYAGVGDGGGGGDPDRNGQDLGVLLGKVLRLDVDGASPYVPADNPFVSTPGARGEIWAFGLRNPWRFAFDRVTGDLFIGDVGQGSREEVDFEPADSPGGLNYCWSAKEGTLNLNGDVSCTGGTPTAPILEYGTHDAGGCAITGGYRYRGGQIPGLYGVYVYGDYCSGRIWGASQNGSGAWTSTQLLDTDRNISTFGEDEAGELYVAHHSTGAGAVYRLVRQPPPPPVVQSVTANRTFPVVAGTAITWTANASGGATPLQYRFWRLDGGSWTLVRDYSTTKTYTWTPGAGEAGQHQVWVWVRNAGSVAAYDAQGGTAPFTITAPLAPRPPPPPVVQSVTANRTFPVVAGTAITWTANASGGATPLQYRFWRLDGGSWTLVRDYSTTKTYTWTPGAGEVGQHQVWVWVRNAGSVAAYDAQGGTAPFTITTPLAPPPPPPPVVQSVTANRTFPVVAGTAITWTANASGGASPLQYRFWRLDGGSWTLVRDYSTAKTYTWTPGAGEVGQHQVWVWVRNAGSVAAYDAQGGTAPFTITAP